MLPKVVLLHDAHAAAGRRDESDVLVEARHIAAGLGSLGYRPSILGVGLDLEDLGASLTHRAPQAVFNLVESLAGHGRLIHLVPALLETLEIPFTGCSAIAQWTTSNKVAAKRKLDHAGIATPELLDAAAQRSGRGEAGAGPWIVKSVWEDASLGLGDDSVIAERGLVPDAIAARRRDLGGEWFAERYIPGREINVAIIATDGGPRVLPVAEIHFENFPAGKPQIVGYAAKWDPSSVEYATTVRSFDVEVDLAAEAGRVAMRCWELFGLSGYARVDFRVDAQQRLWVLEVNANPCLSPDAGFAAMLATAGISFTDALAWILEDALLRAAEAGP